jgi:hypothetical protein
VPETARGVGERSDHHDQSDQADGERRRNPSFPVHAETALHRPCRILSTSRLIAGGWLANPAV